MAGGPERGTGGAGELQSAVAAMESSATRAVVPGELRSWCAMLSTELERVRECVEARGPREGALLDQILTEDPELSSRVAGLRRTRRELGERLDDLRFRASAFQEPPQRASSAEPTKQGEALRVDALAWAVALRAYDGELQTWLGEAVWRDRGVVD